MFVGVQSPISYVAATLLKLAFVDDLQRLPYIVQIFVNIKGRLQLRSKLFLLIDLSIKI